MRLLGGVQLRCGDLVIERFSSRAVAALCARLAMNPQASQGREELAELLWPDTDPATGANRLRNALSTLKRMLNTPALSGHAVILADRRTLRANPSLLDSDVAQFDRLVADARLAEASTLCRGELMPGFYDEWIVDERHRLASACDRVQRGLRPAQAEDAAAPSAATFSQPMAPTASRPVVERRLPRLPDSFFGRESERAALASALQAARLVVVRGPAGCGKSRLALEFAASTTGFDLVAWVSLLGCEQPAQAHEQVRAALGLERADGLPIDQIAARLEGRRTLLVLDNLEHLLREGRAPFVAELLRQVRDLRLIATSQQQVRGQRARDLPLAPLPLPAPGAPLAQLGANPAVRLFVDRARRRRADFALHARNAAAITDIVTLVQGLPLAVELAAARVRQMALPLIGRSLRAAAGRAAGTAQPRHATMAQALGWSWRLLDADRRRDLGLLAAFRGDFDARAAADLLACRADAAATRLRALAQLSWLQPAVGATTPRWSMLAVLRLYAHDHATAATRRVARARHQALFHARTRAYAASGRPVPAAELPDHLHAIEQALATGDASNAAAHALALRPHFVSMGAAAPARSLLQALAHSPRLDRAGRCEIGALLAPLLLDAGDTRGARRVADHARRDAARLAPRLRVAADIAWTHVCWRSQRDGARVLAPAQAALAAARAIDEHALIGRAAMLLGSIVWTHEKDNAQARALFTAAESAFRRDGDARAAATALPGRVVCLLADGDLHAAVAVCESGIAQARRHDDVQTEVLLLNRLAEATARLRRNAASARAGCRLVELASRHTLAYHLAFALWNLALPLARLGRAETAARLMAFSHRYWHEHFGELGDDDAIYVARVRGSALRRLDPGRWEALWEDGERMSTEAAIALALQSDGARPSAGRAGI